MKTQTKMKTERQLVEIAVESEMKNTAKEPETYLDFLMRNCQFQEFRWKREFTEFCIRKFVPKLESKCLEIKKI